jgi:hypothetical protein
MAESDAFSDVPADPRLIFVMANGSAGYWLLSHPVSSGSRHV